MGYLRRVGVVAGVVAVGLAMVGCSSPPWVAHLVTVNGAGTDAASPAETDRFSPPGFAVSSDGTKIAFATRANNLGPTDTNGQQDVYVRDLTAGTTTLVSVNAAGTDSANGNSTAPVFSPDGTKIAFQTTGSDLGPVDTD